MAGVRPAPRQPRQAAHALPVWAATHVRLEDGSGSGPSSYSGGMDEAQLRAALEPAARAERDALPIAGERIQRAGGLRVTKPGGSRETGTYDWPTADAPAPFVQAAPDAMRIMNPAQPVGGRSAAYIPVSSVGGLLSQDAAAERPSTSGGRRTYASNASSGVIGALSTAPPPSPSKLAQPLGGRSLLTLGVRGGIDSVEAAGVAPVGMKLLAHHRSNISFG